MIILTDRSVVEETDKDKHRSDQMEQGSNIDKDEYEHENKERKGKEKEQPLNPSTTSTKQDLDIRLTLRQAGRNDLAKGFGGGGAKPDDATVAEILQKKTTRKRFVGQIWPRDPEGECITPENSLQGKMTSNGVQLWGATMYDFYHVRRIPKLPYASTISTGSKLAAWMKAHGELKHAAPEIAAADDEEDPREVPPYEITGLIESAEDRIRWGVWGKSMRTVTDDEVKEGKGKKKASISLFDALAYPAPWPLVPFSYPATKIQKYIPLHRLPKKLIVHDPWKQLSVEEFGYDSDTDMSTQSIEVADWTKTPDITHTTKRLKTEEKEREREAAKQEELSSGFLIRPHDKAPGPIEPPTFVIRPPEPPEEPIEEAHLYISPDHTAGRGNHSVVYRAEWEVPRSMLMCPKLCESCASEDVKKILVEEDGEDGSKMDPQWKKKSATLKKVQHVRPPVTAKVVDNPDDFHQGDDDDDKDVYTIREGETYDVMEFEGPIRAIHTRVSWQSPDSPYTTECQHQGKPRPATAKVAVIAKLSLEHDPHLANEARNYQKFPKHMFEHWNGFNALPPVHDPTPVGAVVPQFYGYYTPEDDSSTNAKPYLSPILLMEDCGVQLDPSDIRTDDANECRSLYHRFHYAGWIHGSVAPRNILVQRGPLSVPPLFHLLASEDTEDTEFSFRLIDFGRSFAMGNSGEAASMERMGVSRMFRDFPYNVI